jgi:hypothetical protein
MSREPREDLGLEVVVFFHRDRQGDARVTLRGRDIFGIPVATNPAAMRRVALQLEACASELRRLADQELDELATHQERSDAA